MNETRSQKARFCASCGSPAPEGAAFCPGCGSRLGPAVRPGAAAIMRNERKVVTVLFADIKGSIDLVARHDPEQAGEVLQLVVAHMGEQVRRFGGVVNQIMGDGIMALFGAPLALENHAAQACHAALAMRDAIHAQVRPRIELRVGISSGEVVVRAVSGDVSLHYSAAGEPVHFASRMEGAARPDQILLTPAALALTGGLAEVRPLGAIVVKGLDQPIAAFELLRMTRHRQGARGPAFVGREREMVALQSALDQAAEGAPSAVRVIAEAGTGKSRLVGEFTAQRLPPDWTLAQAEAVSHRRTSYGVLVELLGTVFGFAAEDGAEERREKVRAALDLAGPEDDALPPLASLLDFGPSAAWQHLPARLRRQLTIEAAASAIQRASARRPAALIVEDAHWLDPESAESIELLPGGGGGQRLLAIATERPPGTAFHDPSRWRECRMGALDGSATHKLLQALLLPGPEVRALERLLIEHTSGNPLFIEECLQSLVDTGELARVDGRFRIERPVEVLRVPDSLRGLLDARVDRLGDVDKDVLQAAAVVGTSVPEDLLRTVVRLEPAALRPALERLFAAGFLVEAGTAEGGGTPRYAFRHGLIRDAAYNGILLRNRVRMHQAVLDALEQRAGGEADADLLADHAMQAEAWPKAVIYARTAAARARDRYANPESARYYKQALAAASHTQDQAERERTVLGLHIDIREPLFRLGHVHALRPHLDEAVSLADRHNDPGQLGHSHALRSHVLWLAGRPDEAEAAAAEVRRIAHSQRDAALAVRAQFQSALVHLSASRIPEIVAALQEVLDHLGHPPPQRGRYGLDAALAITALCYLARAQTAAGAFAAARQAVATAREYASAAASQQSWIYVHTAAGVLLTAEGHPHRAAHELEQAVDACTQADMRLLRPVACGFHALALIESRQAAKGTALAQESVTEAEQMGFLALHPLRLGILAQGNLVLNRLDEAETAARLGRDLARTIKEPGAEAYAAGLLGEIARRRGDEASAIALLGAGQRQAEALGLHPLAACLRQRIEDPDNRAHPWLDGLALAP